MHKSVSPLAMLRKLRGNLTQEDIAKAIGVSTNTVSRWERGDVTPKLELWQVKKLCSVLGISNIDKLPDTFSPQPMDYFQNQDMG